MKTVILRAFSSNSEINPPHHEQALQLEEHPALEETAVKMQNTHTHSACFPRDTLRSDTQQWHISLSSQPHHTSKHLHWASPHLCPKLFVSKLLKMSLAPKRKSESSDPADDFIPLCTYLKWGVLLPALCFVQAGVRVCLCVWKSLTLLELTCKILFSKFPDPPCSLSPPPAWWSCKNSSC